MSDLYSPLRFLDFHVSIGTLWQDNSSSAVLSFMAFCLPRPCYACCTHSLHFSFLDPAPKKSRLCVPSLTQNLQTNSPVCHTRQIQCTGFAIKPLLGPPRSIVVELHNSKKQVREICLATMTRGSRLVKSAGQIYHSVITLPTRMPTYVIDQDENSRAWTATEADLSMLWRYIRLANSDSMKMSNTTECAAMVRLRTGGMSR